MGLGEFACPLLQRLDSNAKMTCNRSRIVPEPFLQLGNDDNRFGTILPRCLKQPEPNRVSRFAWRFLIPTAAVVVPEKKHVLAGGLLDAQTNDLRTVRHHPGVVLDVPVNLEIDLAYADSLGPGQHGSDDR